MRPMDVRTETDILSMKSDNYPNDTQVWSVLNHTDKVTLHPPENSDWVGWVEIPREQFNNIVYWYVKDQSDAV